jgi:signal transduction histidine kinase
MLLIALLPLLIVLPLLLLTAVRNWSDRFDEVLIAKVHGELTIAHQHLAGLMQSRKAGVEALAQSAAFARLQGAGEDVAAFLEAQRRGVGLDFLYFVDQGGAVARGGDPARWPVVKAALAGQPGAAIDLFSAEDLAAISPALAERARLQLVPTAAAVPTDRTEESRGMVVHAAAPAPGGVLVGGVLLNRNLGFIDEINDLVYPEGSLTEGTLGTATLFLDDVRVSTNVRLFADVRALGTRVSAAVRARVLDEGQVWLDRAFVVNDWYVSGYEPITDSFGARIGMLYVGFLEAGFAAAKRQSLYQVAITFLIVVLLSAPVLLRWARGIFAPLERMNTVIARVEAGDPGARAGQSGTDDEIARVASHLDVLLDRVQERERRLRDWARELEDRVAERTRDLEQANRQLDMTTRQLIISEKLAAIGEITAGVAHEINNPLAVIQGNLDVVREDLGARAEPLETEFRLIHEQVQAINILVSKLLHFARPEEFADVDTAVAADKVVLDTLPLVQHVLGRSGIELVTDLGAGATVAINQTELQQVLVNLIVNAIQAMPGGGRIDIRSRTIERDGKRWVRIEVEDTGSGMPPDVIARVFDPFFTTKRSVGTGLGLSISRTLIGRAGGDITVQSAPGEGSRFVILLPAHVSRPA